MTMQQSNYIKLIAITTMLIDHIGVILFPGVIILRIIGRIAFPLFAYQLSIGFEHTRNFKKYIFRIVFFALCLQLFYSIAIYFFKIDLSLNKLNIFFTLSFGLIAIYFYEKKKYIYLILILAVLIVINFYNISLDYGMYGIAIILTLYAERKCPIRMVAFIVLFSFAYCYFLYERNYIQMFSIMSLLFIFKPVSLKLNIPGFVFYIFYPLHLALLYLISMVLSVMK